MGSRLGPTHSRHIRLTIWDMAILVLLAVAAIIFLSVLPDRVAEVKGEMVCREARECVETEVRP